MGRRHSRGVEFENGVSSPSTATPTAPGNVFLRRVSRILSILEAAHCPLMQEISDTERFGRLLRSDRHPVDQARYGVGL